MSSNCCRLQDNFKSSHRCLLSDCLHFLHQFEGPGEEYIFIEFLGYLDMNKKALNFVEE